MFRKTEQIIFSQHALDQLADRGATQQEVVQTIQDGEVQIVKKGRLSFKKNFSFENIWKGRYYSFKQVMPIAAREEQQYVVITVYTFFFGERR